MAEREHDEGEERVEDLDPPEGDAEDVKGGALNAYISKVTGQKQGEIKGSVTQK